MVFELNGIKASKGFGTAAAGYAAAETVGMPVLMGAGESISITSNGGAVIAVIGALVAYNLIRIFTS